METNSAGPQAAGLQFERAEFDGAQTGRLSCAGCKSEIGGAYFAVGDKTVCPSCKVAIEAAWQSGSGAGRVFRALLFGIPAAALGSGVYYAIAKLTGYEFGLVAVVIGLLVGSAVRYGSNRRGGWVYQTIAVCLTYLSIASTYVPFVIEEAMKQHSKDNPVGAAATGTPEDPAPPAEETDARPAAVVGSESESPGKGDAAPVPVGRGSENAAPSLLLAVGVLLALAIALPVLGGLQNLMGLVIIGIGLYEAWKLNKRVVLQITGPYDVTAGPPVAAGTGGER